MRLYLRSAFFGVLVTFVSCSVFCPHTAYPSKAADFDVVSIQTKEQPARYPVYRIVSNSSNADGLTRKSKSFRLLVTPDNSECPRRKCMMELAAMEPKSEASVLYQTSMIGKVVPPGFRVVELPKRYYCVTIPGDCGATVPLMRYYRLAEGGLYHAYSLSEDDLIANYTLETLPVCYVWPLNRETEDKAKPKKAVEKPTEVAKKPVKQTVEKKHQASIPPQVDDFTCGAKHQPPMDSMMKLSVYDNGETGYARDHYYTTSQPGESYKRKDDLGFVVTKLRASKCDCLIQLNQMHLLEKIPFTREDHMLIAPDKEPVPAHPYVKTGEKVYCAMEYGSCGATVPLRKYFYIGDFDTLLTVNTTTIPPFSVPSPPGVLCYIWPIDYSPKLEAVKKQKEEDDSIDDNLLPSASNSTALEDEPYNASGEDLGLYEADNDEELTEAVRA